MNEEFVTKAIENDRYLKATRLKRQFEDEIIRELENTCKAIVAAKEGLFVENDSPDSKKIPYPSTALATFRVDYPMNRVDSLEGDRSRLKLNIAMEWVDPETQAEEEPTSGALCYVHYKIKNASQEDFENVKRQTLEDGHWGIRFGEDVYNNAPGIYYIAVKDAADIKDAFQTIHDHIWQYGEEFGVADA